MMQLCKLGIVLKIIVGILLVCSCTGNNSSSNNTSQNFCIPDSLLKNLTYDTIHAEPAISELTLSGKITLNEDNVVKIYPLVSGHVSDVKVSLGDFVEKGRVLTVIRSSDMANYFNDYKSAQSELAIALKNREVTGNMRSTGVSSEKDYLVAENEYQKALSQYNKMKEVLKINGSSFSPDDSTGSRYVIKAPISGFIAEKNITIGMDIRTDANDNLFTISDLKEVWALANVFESDISKIKVGGIAEVTTLSYPDRKLSGKVGRISNILDPETKIMSIKILLKNDDFALKPGMFANISLRIPENKRMLSVKSSSIIFDDNKSYILRFRGKCNVQEQQISIFRTLNNTSFIEADSLKENDIAIGRNGLFIYTAIKNL